MDEAELVDGLQKGDARCQLALLSRYQDREDRGGLPARLAEYLLRFSTLDSGDVEDIVVEVLYQLAFEPSRIDLSKGLLNGLVFKMAKNRAIDLHRKRKRALSGKNIVALDAPGVGSENLEDETRIVDRRPHHGSEGSRQDLPVEVIAEARQLVADLDLPEDQWEHLRLRVVDKLQPKEIAGYLGITDNNERVRWHRLRNRIQRERAKYPHLAKHSEGIGEVNLDT
jgi:RNA polymerase sigma factor (sigma-70 family)